MLDKLRFGETAEERNEALGELKTFEDEGRFEAKDLMELLEDEEPVLKMYAIGALGRLKIESSIPKLSELYLDSDNPLVLEMLLDAFLLFNTNAFVSVVLKRIKKSRKITRILKKKPSLDTIFDNDFIIDQILIPSLKYLQTAGDPKKIEKGIHVYLDHSDSNVRFHTLVAYQKLAIPLDEKILREIAETDKNALVREQAAIMRAIKKKE